MSRDDWKKFAKLLYNIVGRRIERRNPEKIKVKSKHNPLVRLSAPLRIKIKKKAKQGLVTKVE